MLQSRREYRCVKCEHRFTLTADLEQRHQMPIPDECPSHNAKPCRGGKFEFVEGTEVCKDYQEVRARSTGRNPSAAPAPVPVPASASAPAPAPAPAPATAPAPALALVLVPALVLTLRFPQHLTLPPTQVRIQEQIHRLTVGSIPRSITLILQDDLVDARSHVEDKPGTARVPARPKRLIGRGWPELGAA